MRGVTMWYGRPRRARAGCALGTGDCHCHTLRAAGAPAAGLPARWPWALGSLTVAERLAQDILALFMYPGLEPRHVDEVAETMLDELNGGMSV